MNQMSKNGVLSEKTHLRVKYKFGTIFIFFKGEIENTIFIRRSLLSDNTPNLILKNSITHYSTHWENDTDKRCQQPRHKNLYTDWL